MPFRHPGEHHIFRSSDARHTLLPMMDDNSVALFIGARLKRYRIARGLSQSDLGAMLGLSFQQIQKYERGANRIGAGILLRAAHHLNQPVTAFLPRGDEHDDDIALAEALASAQGVRLLAAFAAISSAKGREAAAFLVEAIAEADRVLPGKKPP